MRAAKRRSADSGCFQLTIVFSLMLCVKTSIANILSRDEHVQDDLELDF